MLLLLLLLLLPPLLLLPLLLLLCAFLPLLSRGGSDEGGIRRSLGPSLLPHGAWRDRRLQLPSWREVNKQECTDQYTGRREKVACRAAGAETLVEETPAPVRRHNLHFGWPNRDVRFHLESFSFWKDICPPQTSITFNAQEHAENQEAIKKHSCQMFFRRRPAGGILKVPISIFRWSS